MELERINLTKYVNSVLTAYVVKTPPEYEGALKVLHLLKGGFFELLWIMGGDTKKKFNWNWNVPS